MADDVSKIILDVSLTRDAELEKRIKAIAQLTQEIDGLKEANKKLDKTTQEGAEAFAKNEVTIRSLNKELSKNKTFADLLTTTNEKVISSNDQMRKTHALLTKELNAMGAEEKKTTERGKYLIENLRLISDEMKANEKAIGDNRRNVGNYTEAIEEVSLSLGDMKKQLRELKNTSFAGKTEEEIQGIQQQIGKLTNDMGDMQAQVKAMDKGEMLNNFAGSLQGVVSGVQLLSASLSAMGVESEWVKKLEASTMQLISASQALQSIRDLNEKGTFKAFASQVKETGAKVQSTVATWAQTNAEAAKTVMTGKASMATKAYAGVQLFLNKVMAANPVLLLVAGFAALAAGAYFLVKALTKVTQAEKDRQTTAALNKKIAEDVQSSTGELVTKLEFYRSIVNDTSKSEKERTNALKAIEKETNGVIKATDLNTTSLAKLNAEMDSYLKKAVAKAEIDARIKALAETNIELENRRNGTLAETTTIWQKVKNAVLSGGNAVNVATREASDAQKNSIEAISELERKKAIETEALTKLYVKNSDVVVDNADKTVKAADKSSKGVTKAKDDIAAKEKALFDQQKANEKEYADYIINLQGELNQVIFNQYEIRIGEINAQEKKIQDVIDKSLQTGLLTQEQYEKKKVEITKEYGKQRLDAEAEFALVDLQKITDQELAKYSQNELQKLLITQDYLNKKLAIEQKAGHDTEALQAEIAQNEATIRQKNLDIALLDQTKSLTQQHKLKMDFM